ncbi:RSP_2648 family PIN domain-containing protein [Poseidonocella sp. HB161398]|uniref:RSP_2648 family PIN domain-containing protein n=1 Tax=Poseidonocella sp. HB161398 TaxID=2320855 RepID=UPI001109BD29|nr:PIN domain-containing protein [Poseidonocella sp. HB161398]
MRAVLDACVLFPTLTRGLLLDAAAAGVFTPLWSPRIAFEWTHAAGRETPAAEVAAEAAMLAARWPGAEVALPDGLEATLSLPDPDDIHVLAAAIAGEAQAIVTFNMRDFPGRTLARHGVTPWHPDSFLLEALREAEAPMLDALRARLSGLRDGDSPRALLKRARLPRFAKAAEPLL